MMCDGDSCTMLHIMQLTGCTKGGDCAYNDQVGNE